jgi:hypothetical protein
MVLNLVKLARAEVPCHIVRLMLSFSAKSEIELVSQNPYKIKMPMILISEILYFQRVKLKIVA